MPNQTGPRFQNPSQWSNDPAQNRLNAQRLDQLLQQSLRSAITRLGLNTTQAQTTSSTSTDLMSVSLPSGFIGTDGTLRITAQLHFVNADAGACTFSGILGFKDGSGTYTDLDKITASGLGLDQWDLYRYNVEVVSTGMNAQVTRLARLRYNEAGTSAIFIPRPTTSAVNVTATGTATATKSAISILIRGNNSTGSGFHAVVADHLLVEFIPS